MSLGSTCDLCNPILIDSQPYRTADKDDVAQRQFIMLEDARVSLQTLYEHLPYDSKMSQPFLEG